MFKSLCELSSNLNLLGWAVVGLAALFLFHDILLHIIDSRLHRTKLRLRELLDDYEKKIQNLSTRVKNLEQQHTDDQR